MTTKSKQGKTAGELAEMFIRQAEGRRQVKDGGGEVFLSERQADWFLSVYEREQPAGTGSKDYIYGYLRTLTHGDLKIVWGKRSRNGSLMLEYHSIAEAAKQRAEDDARRATAVLA